MSTQNLVSFERVAPSDECTTAYRQLHEATRQAPDLCQSKCVSICVDANSGDNAQKLYALAGLRLTNLSADQFKGCLEAVRTRPGQVEYSAGGSNRQMMSMRDAAGLFTSKYRSASDFHAPDWRAPPGPTPVTRPRGGLAPGRNPAPPHQQPRCDQCRNDMTASLLHVDAFCDTCKIPLPPTVPAWSCERCDADLCHQCCIRKFAPQMLAGGSAGPLPTNPPVVHNPPRELSPAQRLGVFEAAHEEGRLAAHGIHARLPGVRGGGLR